MATFTGTNGIDVLPPIGADSSGDDTMSGLGGNDTLLGGGGDDTLLGGLGADTLRGGDGNDVLVGGGGGDVYIGGAGDDTVDYSDAATEVIVNLFGGLNLGSATGDVYSDVVERLRGSAFDDILTGDDNGTSLSGQDGNDTIRGLGGDDLLDGGAGNDQIDGGEGDDTLVGGAGADDLFGGAGDDIVTYAASAAAVRLNLTTGVNQDGDAEGDRILDHVELILGSSFADSMIGAAAADHFRGADGNDDLHGAGGDDLLEGENGDDTLSGEDGNDDLRGGAGVDQLVGGAGDDVMRSGTGASDHLEGGAGTDTVSYDDSEAGVSINLAAGTATGGTAQNDQYGDHIEAFIGSGFADTLTGGADADDFFGADGDDTLAGGGGADRLRGGAGNDTVTYAGSAAAVHLNLLTNVNTGGDAQGDIFVFQFETTIGSAFADTMIGSNAIDTLRGGDGNDQLAGGGLGDVLYGGNGDDALDGGSSNDWLNGGAGADSFLGGGQTDTVSYQDSSAGVTVNLTTNVSTGGDAQGDSFLDQVEVVVGSGFDDRITGGSQASAFRQTLEGGAGNDVLTAGNSSFQNQLHFLDGGTGNDTLIGGFGQNSYTGGDGIDTVDYSGMNHTVSINLYLGAGTGSGYALGFTDTYRDHIEIFIGTAFNDTMLGSALDDTFRGGGGNDRLEGRGGADTLAGGGQSGDRFVYTAVSDSTVAASDTIIGFAGGGSTGKIDLAQIDADANSAGNQAFTFIGTGPFSGVAGQLHYALSGGETVISGDVNGDGVADLRIVLSGLTGLNAGDFIL